MRDLIKTCYQYQIVMGTQMPDENLLSEPEFASTVEMLSEHKRLREGTPSETSGPMQPLGT